VNRRSITAAASLVVIIASIAWILTSARRKPIQEIDVIQAGLIEATLEQTTKVAGGSGRILFIQCAFATWPPADLQANLAKALQSQSGISVIATETVNGEAPVFPAETYLRFLQSHPEVDAVVSLAGPPIGDEQLPAKRPKFIAVIPWVNPSVAKPALERGWIDVAIAPRTRVIPVDKQHPPKTPRDWFEHACEVVTRPPPSTER